MKLLLDSCVYGAAKEQLRALGHEVEWAGDLAEDPGDEALLARATAEQRVLVTLDKDFGELAVLRHLPHSGIVRLVGFRGRDQAAACQLVVLKYGAELAQGALATVEPGRIRIRSRD